MKDLRKMFKRELDKYIESTKNKYWDSLTIHENVESNICNMYSKGQVTREYICNLCSKAIAEKEIEVYNNAIETIDEMEQTADFTQCYVEIRTVCVNEKSQVKISVISNDFVYEKTGTKESLYFTILDCLLEYKPFARALYCYANQLATEFQHVENIFGNKELIFFYNYTPCIDPLAYKEENFKKLLCKLKIYMKNSEAKDCFRYELNEKII